MRKAPTQTGTKLYRWEIFEAIYMRPGRNSYSFTWDRDESKNNRPGFDICINQLAQFTPPMKNHRIYSQHKDTKNACTGLSNIWRTEAKSRNQESVFQGSPSVYHQ